MHLLRRSVAVPLRALVVPVAALLTLSAHPPLAHAAEPPVPYVGPPAPSPDPVGTWPLRPAPEVVTRFDPPAERWGSGHRGVDLAGSIGEPVRAALDGRVGFVGSVAGVRVVVVHHGSTRTTYQPVDASVSTGDHVAAGDVLGTLAWFGTHCLPRACLHWGWVRGEEYLDPLRLVDAPRPVRLLPLGGAPSPAPWQPSRPLFGGLGLREPFPLGPPLW